MQIANNNSNEQGFTLIELLVVVAIIGILASIGLSTYGRTRSKAFDVMAKSDLRNAISAQEAYFASNEEYIPCTDTADCGATLPGFSSSGPQVSISFTVPTPDTIVGTAFHSSGTLSYEYNSTTGSIVEN